LTHATELLRSISTRSPLDLRSISAVHNPYLEGDLSEQAAENGRSTIGSPTPSSQGYSPYAPRSRGQSPAQSRGPNSPDGRFVTELFDPAVALARPAALGAALSSPSRGPSPMPNHRALSSDRAGTSLLPNKGTTPYLDRASTRTTPVGTPPLDNYTPMLPPMKTPISVPLSRGSSWGKSSPPLLDQISAPSSAPHSGGSPPLSDEISVREMKDSSRDSSRDSLARTPHYSSAQVEVVDWDAVGLQVIER
jgi:hypothetical protein